MKGEVAMRYSFNGKNLNIPDSIIESSMKNLELTKEEAIQMYLEDEGYLINDEQVELTKKAKDSRITATIHQAKDIKKKTQRERVRKPNPTKEMIIQEIYKILPDFAENIEIINPSKLITFNIGEKKFKIDLIQQREAKK